MTYPLAPSYDLRAGPLISASIRVFFDNPIPFSVAVLAPALVTLGMDQVLNARFDGGAGAGGNIGITALYILGTVALFAITQVVIVLMTFSAAAGRPVRLGDACIATIPLLGRAMALFLAQVLIFGAMMLVFLLLSWLNFPVFLSAVLGLIGLVWLYMTLFVSAPALVAGAGPIAAMKRSRALTDGFRWHIFASFAGLVGIIIVISAVLAVLFSVTGGALGDRAQEVISALLAAPLHILSGLIYLRLVDVKEGGDTSQIAKVFE